jgi:small subunit ribosomal protein S4
MARYKEAVCRLCRREGIKLFLKGEKCYTDKCPVTRRPYAPGEHGRRRSKESEYYLQLREKQKAKRYYGVLEKQFRNYYKKAVRQKGITGENLLKLLERRLDNVVYRLGFAFSRAEARQLVRHGHFAVNGKRVNIPSYLVRVGDVINAIDSLPRIKEAAESATRPVIPSWLEVDREKLTGKVVDEPKREEIDAPVEEKLIVELYSK